MPRHPDAIGYLNNLAQEVCEPWFTMISDLAITGIPSLDKIAYDTLAAIFLGQADYLSMQPNTAQNVPVITSVTPVTDFLETLCGFSNFKRLDDALQIRFTKPITLIFGGNGSGKSSLCESLKVLASQKDPSRPIHNVLSGGASVPSFCYKFRSDGALQSWTPRLGYGFRHSTIKYFDVEIAHINLQNAVEPGRIVVLTPFKLHLFEQAKSLTTQFREYLQKMKRDNADRLARTLENVRKEFSGFKDRPLASIEEKSLPKLAAEIKVGEEFNGHHMLKKNQTAIAELEKAASKDGLKLLKAEQRDLKAFLAALQNFLDYTESLWKLQPVEKASMLAIKRAAQESLAHTLIPENGTLEGLLSLLHAAAPFCGLKSSSHQICPLCKRELNVPEIELFKKYHELITDEIEKEIESLKADIAKASELTKIITAVNRSDWANSAALPVEVLTDAKNRSELVFDCCGLSKEPTTEAQTEHRFLRTLHENCTKTLEQKTKAIEFAEKGGEELEKQLLKLCTETEPLEYANSIALHLDLLKSLQIMFKEATFWEVKLPPFTPLLRKITDTAKTAHDELIVSDFENRLNGEYEALSEKQMNAFGVTLVSNCIS